MSFKHVLSIVLFIFILSGCGSKGVELMVGTYNEHEEVVFNKDKTLKNKESIEQVKSIINASSTSGIKSKGKPDYVVIVHNKDDSTMELRADLWLQADGTITFNRGEDSEEMHSINKENSETIKKLLQI
ncbi:hypothetical protein CDO73_25130 [Saccharibacillus sp. O23]|uniref:hypothetical protein n=1 Tax=Saccharibacillus sp. O23 TaxID=2009338 RepID=UPI000B4E0019|nr:hypothetical protein [Saccharibacillus sp. O23]OWR26675.1 hypothetical protein CDO73_25130 [Saccharibacillus sp. O23]